MLKAHRQKRYALLIAALLLLSNALVTAHAFGEVDHAVKDGCELLHQFERQQHAPVSEVAVVADVRGHVLPVAASPREHAIGTFHHFHARAPPSV